MPGTLLEVCVDNVECAVTAGLGGAARVELCDNLAQDGTTPSAGTIATVRSLLTIPVHVMIRPRGGDFIYGSRELDVMRRDIDIARAYGADGVVFGILDADRRIDARHTEELAGHAAPMDITFHRAFDEVTDPVAALAIIRSIGIRRILSSGLSPSVTTGMDMLKKLSDLAGDDISIMPGGGVTPAMMPRLRAIPGIREIHVSSAVKRRLTLHAPNTGANHERAVVDPLLLADCILALETAP